MQKDLKKEEQQSPLWQSVHSAFLSFIHSHISAEAMHDRVFFLLRAYREFYYAKRVSHEYTGQMMSSFCETYILTTPVYSSGNRIRSTIGSSSGLYF